MFQVQSLGRETDVQVSLRDALRPAMLTVSLLRWLTITRLDKRGHGCRRIDMGMGRSYGRLCDWIVAWCFIGYDLEHNTPPSKRRTE